MGRFIDDYVTHGIGKYDKVKPKLTIIILYSNYHYIKINDVLSDCLPAKSNMNCGKYFKYW